MSILGQPLKTKKYYLYKSYDRRNSGQENCHGHGYEVMRHKSQQNLSFQKSMRTLPLYLGLSTAGGHQYCHQCHAKSIRRHIFTSLSQA